MIVYSFVTGYFNQDEQKDFGGELTASLNVLKKLNIRIGYSYTDGAIHTKTSAQTDLDLASSFQEESKKVVKQLFNVNAKVYSSPLKRCKLLAEKIDSEIIVDSRLLELNFGDWEMKSWEEIPKKKLDTWMNNYLTKRPGNGEMFCEMEDRVRSFLNDVILDNRTVIVVAHAGVIRMINGIIKKMPQAQWMGLKINYGDVITLSGI